MASSAFRLAVPLTAKLQVIGVTQDNNVIRRTCVVQELISIRELCDISTQLSTRIRRAQARAISSARDWIITTSYSMELLISASITFSSSRTHSLALCARHRTDHLQLIYDSRYPGCRLDNAPRTSLSISAPAKKTSPLDLLPTLVL